MSAMRRILILTLAVVGLLLPVRQASAADPRNVRISFTRLETGLTQPVGVAFPSDGTKRIFMIEQPGRIRVRSDAGVLLSTPYLDIRDRVLDGGERGLLGMAFHPNFRTNGRFFVFYTRNDGDLVVSRFGSTPSRNTANRSSELRILTIEHSQNQNHNGGMLAFKDGYLYIATGDGGGAGDPEGNAQDYSSLLGKILRININSSCNGRNYCVPSSNPFVGQSGRRGEIFHLGLRNPWRFSFDRTNGGLWIGDAGQQAQEEVDGVNDGAIGRNFGWDCREGTLNTVSQYGGSYCSGRTFQPPVHTYRQENGRCVVIGGYRYRGSTYRAILDGVYVYADYCTGEVFGLNRLSNGSWVNARLYDHSAIITSFGQGPTGGLYAVGGSGVLWRLNAHRR